MSKIELPAVTGNNNASRINDNFQKIEDALNQEVLYRKGYVGEPNEMEIDLDMNGKRILNLPDAASLSEPVTLRQLQAVESGVDSALRIELINSVIDEEFGNFVLRDITSVCDNPSVVGDGIADDTVALQQCIDSAPVGGSLLFPGGKSFLFNKLNLTKPVVLVGEATLIHNGFRIKSSNVISMLTGQQICRTYQSSSRAFHCFAYEDAQNYENIKVLFNRFSGFFYSTDLRGIGYSAGPSDPTNRVVKDVLIMGCQSVGPELTTGVTSGHYQCTGVTNVKCVANSAYGGGGPAPFTGATSYNFINGNGYLVVQGNYDHDNTYGSMEIENNQVTHAVISGNVFKKQIWVDDSSNVSISGNSISDRILITCQTNDTDNINISGNTCSSISVTAFGDSPVGKHRGVAIVGNTIYGGAGSNDIFADSSVARVTIECNSLNGQDTNAVALSRSSACDHLVRNNRSRSVRPLLIAGSGGRIIEYGNDNMTTFGLSESRHLSNIMAPSSSYPDLPGKYLHGTKYTGSIAPLGAVAIVLPIPESINPSFRGVALWVMIRDTATNNISSFRVDGRYIYTGSTQLNFGTAYSSQGADPAAVTVANNASTSNSINILLTNTSGTKTLQVTVMPEVSSRLGTEE